MVIDSGGSAHRLFRLPSCTVHWFSTLKATLPFSVSLLFWSVSRKLRECPECVLPFTTGLKACLPKNESFIALIVVDLVAKGLDETCCTFSVILKKKKKKKKCRNLQWIYWFKYIFFNGFKSVKFSVELQTSVLCAVFIFAKYLSSWSCYISKIGCRRWL